MKIFIIICALILTGCPKEQISDKWENLGLTEECKGDGMYGYFCKYTNKVNDSVCFKRGETSFSVPCSFYENL